MKSQRFVEGRGEFRHQRADEGADPFDVDRADLLRLRLGVTFQSPCGGLEQDLKWINALRFKVTGTTVRRHGQGARR